MRGRTIAVAAALMLVGSPAAGQRGRMVQPGTMLERQVEASLERRDELGLTEGQVAELEALRTEIESAFGSFRAEMQALREGSGEGAADRAEARARMTEQRDRQRALMARFDTIRSPLQARFEAAVTPLQRQALARDGRRQGSQARVGAGRTPGAGHPGMSPRASRGGAGGWRAPRGGRMRAAPDARRHWVGPTPRSGAVRPGRWRLP